MTTPIMKALDIAQQPPYILGWQELDIFIRDITAIYEQQTHNDREAYLIDDCVSLILRHRMAKVDGENMTNNSPVRLYPNRSEKDLKNIQGCIEEIARLLLRVTDSLNTRLPESFIEQCRNSTEESASKFYEIIRRAYITPEWKTKNKADSGTTAPGMGNNTTAGTETPPADTETPKLAILPPYTPEPIGRPAGDFIKTIADDYTNKADIILTHTQTALASMTDPQAVIALFIVYFKKGILKQCPTYWQALRLLDIKAGTDKDKENLCPFGKHQQYGTLRNIYFDKNDSYLSLNETDNKQDNDISSFIQDAETTVKTLLDELRPQKGIVLQGA